MNNNHISGFAAIAQAIAWTTRGRHNGPDETTGSFTESTLAVIMNGLRSWMPVVKPLGDILVDLLPGISNVVSMPGRSYSGPFLPLEGEEEVVRERLEQHVWSLAGEIGQRNMPHYPSLEAAARYIEQTWQDLGFDVVPQEFVVDGQPVRNLEVEITGTSRADEILILSAHYDTVPGCPGADDNATGTAAILELARLLAGKKLDKTVRLVAFVNEEFPYFFTDDCGSRVYARRSKQRGEKIAGVLCIETIGYYSDRAGSQCYPLPFALYYPDTANFIGFVGNTASRGLVHRAIESFRRHTKFPSEGIAAPLMVADITRGDNLSFWVEGYPALMVTDTANFRNKHYHAPSDTPEKLSYDRMARVVTGLARMVVDLATEGPGPT